MNPSLYQSFAELTIIARLLLDGALVLLVLTLTACAIYLARAIKEKLHP